MSPSDQVVVLARPSRFLVLRIADDSHGTELPDRKILPLAGLCGSEHEGAFDVLARVIALMHPFPHIDQVPRHVCRLAVLGQYDGLGGVARQLEIFSISDLGEFTFVRIPRLARALRAIVYFPVGGKL